MKELFIVGDSFTYGDELSDFMLPEFPGYVPRAAAWPRALTDWNKIKYDVYNKTKQRDPELYNKLDQFRLDNRWPTILGNNLNATVFNAGANGKSIFNYLNAVVDYVSKGNKPDLMIIQLTGFDRSQLYLSDQKDSMYCQHNYFQCTPSLDREFANLIYTKELISYLDKLLVLQSSDDFLYAYLTCIKQLQMIAKLLTGKDLVIVDSVFKFHIDDVLQNTKNTDLLELADEVKINDIISMRSVYDNNLDTNMNPGAHYCYKTNKIFADAVTDLVKGML